MTGALGALETAFWGILTFSILIVLHEMGHFLAARAFGVKVHEFMVGLPGPSLRLHTKNMDWGVTAVPLGGYVRIAGMEPGPEDSRMGDALLVLRDNSPMDAVGLASRLGVDEERAGALLAAAAEWKAARETDDGHYEFAMDGDTAGMGAQALADAARSVTYRGQSAWKRITILSMGVVTNLVVAILTFTLVLSIWGYYDVTTTIDSVSEDSPAVAAGLVAGDKLVAVDGSAVEGWEEFQLLMADTKPGEVARVTVERDGERLTLPVTLAEKDGHGFVGIGPEMVAVHPNVFEALGESLRYVRMTAETILNLFRPSTFSGTIKSFTGVVGVSVMAEEAVKAGALSYAGLIAMLSLSLGIMNILPLPPLDGGKIVLEIVEKIMGKPVPRSLSLGLSATGALLLFSLIGFIMYQDILRFAL